MKWFSHETVCLLVQKIERYAELGMNGHPIMRGNSQIYRIKSLQDNILKVGKTTLATQMPKALLLAFEPGYHALPGVIAQDITSWSEMRQVLRELKKPEVKEMFQSIVVDTVDISADYCKKYVCSQHGIEDLADAGYGKGYTWFKDEFNDVFRTLSQLGYAVVFLGHDKEIVSEDGKSKIIRSALNNSTRTVIAGMSDLYGYAHQKEAGQMSVLTLRCSDGSIECGGRFKYIDEEIPMNYQSLVDAVRRAIDKEAAEHSNKFVTDERIAPVPKTETLDYDALMAEFQTLAGELMTKSSSNGVKITSIVERYLGKGKKASEATPDQVEMLNLIILEMRDLNK